MLFNEPRAASMRGAACGCGECCRVPSLVERYPSGGVARCRDALHHAAPHTVLAASGTARRLATTRRQSRDERCHRVH